MTKPVVSIPPDVEISVAAQRMAEHHVNHLVVVSDDRVLGVITHLDLEQHRPLYDDKWYVEDLMREPVITATPDMTTAEAARIMRGSSLGCLPIVDLLDVLARG